VFVLFGLDLYGLRSNSYQCLFLVVAYFLPELASKSFV